MSSISERKMFGSPTYRSTIKCLTPGTAIDTITTSGTAYTFSGGELLEISNEGPSAVYIEAVVSGSYTAAGAKSVLLEAGGEPLLMTLKAGVTTITADSISSTANVFVREKQID
jgi:hypothetical protein